MFKMFSVNRWFLIGFCSSTTVIRKTILHIILISVILCGNRSSCRLEEFQSSVSSAFANVSTIDFKHQSPANILQSLFISAKSLQTSPIVSKLSIIPTASETVDIKTEQNLNDLPRFFDSIGIVLSESATSCSGKSTEQTSLEVEIGLADETTVLTEAVQKATLVTVDVITPSQEETSATVVDAGTRPPANDTISQPDEPANQTAEPDNKVMPSDTEAMPSFDEWKKKKQAEFGEGEKPSLGVHQPGAVVSASGAVVGGPSNPSGLSGKKVMTSQKRRRNYASYECGAKVVASNRESEGSGRILNEQMDEYMLNPCQAKIWFVIELCDSIQVSQLELANFELFSSLPKEFTVSASDQYPTRDWTPLGTFMAQDQRLLHTFPLMQQGYGKFLMVEFLSHYGNEHYCPLSVVRVFGISMVDEFEDLEATEHASSVASADAEDGPVIPSTSQAEASNDIFGSARKAVLTIINKAALVLGREEVAVPSEEGDTPESNLSIASTHTKLFSGSSLGSEDELLNCANHSLSELHEIALFCGFCAPSLSKILSNKCSFLRTVLNISGFDKLTSTCQCEPQETSNSTRDAQKSPNFDKTGSSLNIKDSFVSASESTKFSSSRYIGTVHLDSSRESTNNVAHTANFSDSSLHEQTKVLSSVTLTHVDASSVNSEQSETVLFPSLVEPSASATNTISTPVSLDAFPETSLPVDFPDDVVMGVPVVPDDEIHGGTKTEPMGVSVSSTQKESVFVRLNNRIRQLEANLSLSSQYLQELSQRYRKQMEDMQKGFNRTVEALNQTAVLANERDQQQQASLAALQKQMEQMTGLVQKMHIRNRTLYREVLETHIFIIAVEAIIVVTVLTLCWRRYRLHDQRGPVSVSSQSLPSFGDENNPLLGVTRTPLKRHHSVCDVRMTLNGTKKPRPTTYSDLMIVEPAIPIYIEQPHKGRKRHRNRKNKNSLSHSVSNPNLNLSCISEVMDSTKTLPYQHSPISNTTAGVLFFPSSSQEGSENCENCSPNKIEDAGSHTKIPFQNLTNTKVNKDKLGTCKIHFSLQKPLKIQEKKGAV